MKPLEPQGDSMTITRLLSGLVIGLAVIALGTIAQGADESHIGEGHGEPAAHAPVQHGEAGAAHDTEHGGEIDPLEFKGDLAIWTAVVFIVLLAILWKFAWGPIASGLEKRERGVAEQIDQADRANRQAQELLGQYEQKLADAKGEVRGIIEQGRRDAERVGREMIDKAKDEAAAEQQQALQQIDNATSAALKELAEKGVDLAVDLAGRIVHAELKPDDHAGLIEQAVGRFAGTPPDRN